jgi:hypothetical protein
MRLVEIQDGVMVNADKIEGVKKLNNDTCEVYVGTRVYLSTIPYSTLMSMLKLDNVVDNGLSKNEQIGKTMEKVANLMEKQSQISQFWSG